MARQRSYDPTSENRDMDSEMARLAAQATLSWDVESRRMLWLGLSDGMRVLEPGCGPGFSTQLLRALLPHSAITALDSDPDMLALASQRTRTSVKGDVELRLASVTDTGLPPDSFDAAVSRYLFQHLADPTRAAREILRVLKPGGRHIVIDVDDDLWGLAEPTFAPLRSIYARATAAQARRGGTRLIGRRLGRILREAGYGKVQLDVFCCDSDELGMEPFRPQISPDRLLPLVGEHALGTEELALAYLLHQRFLEDEKAFVAMVGFIAYGEKPS